MFSQSELENSEPIWLFTVEWRGVVHRFSKYPISIQSENGENYQYNGTLIDFDYMETTDLIGVNVEGDSVSMALVFPDVDFVKEWRRGFVIDGSRCELSYVLKKNGHIQQSYERRQILFVGYASGSVFGDPLEPIGFVSFSVDAKPYDFGGLMLDPSHVITYDTFNDGTPAPTYPWEDTKGKSYPFVFGYAGEPFINSKSTVLSKTYATPAYPVLFDPTIGEIGAWRMMIAGHRVEADNVLMRDSLYASSTFQVFEDTDKNGVLYSYVNLGGGLQLPTDSETKREYWVSWGHVTGAGVKYGGGALNPFGDGALNRGGDVILYCLQRTGAAVDWQAWKAITPLLNEYRFSGYINQPDVTAWDFVVNNILAFMPVEARSSVNGIRPLLALQFITPAFTPPMALVATNPDFQVVSAIEMATDLEQIVNEYTVQFAINGSVDQAVGYHTTTANRVADFVTISSSHYAWISQNQYGVHQLTEKAIYVYDYETAAKIANEKIRAKAFPFRSFEIMANVKYGFIMVGDVIRLNSEELYLNNAPVLVVGKQWNNTGWMFRIHIEDNPILIERMT